MKVILKKISDWVSAGGKLIAVGAALKKLEGESGFSWTRYSSPEEKQKAEDQQKEEEKKRINRIYGDRIRGSISDEIPGAIVKNQMDDSHPLAYGFPNYYFSLKTGSDSLPTPKGYLECRDGRKECPWYLVLLVKI